MTREQAVADFLNRFPGIAFCDDCLCEELSFTCRQHVNHKTLKLSGQREFVRGMGPCSVCRKTGKLVIQSVVIHHGA